MSLRLYEIANEYKFLLDNLYDDETGVVDESAFDKLKELSDPLETKCINITRIFKQLDAEREAIEKERKAMAARESSLKNQVARLKDYLLSNMERCEIKEIKCPQFAIRLQKNPVKLDIFDEALIPPDYEVMTLTLDEAKIKGDLKNGVFVPGARLVQNNSLRIK